MNPLLVTAALLISGCYSSAIASPPTPQTPTADACDSKFTRNQFIGAWNDEGSVTTLNSDGFLSSPDGPGKWEYTRWDKTPNLMHNIPTGQESQCVLWLKDPPPGLVYYPLTVTPTHLTLSYVERGNTHVWTKDKS